jgi:hypothetical protein
MALFEREEILAEGAGAVYLKNGDTGLVLEAITSPQSFLPNVPRSAAASRVRAELESVGAAPWLFNSSSHRTRGLNRDQATWDSWAGEQVSIRRITGNAFCASSAWQVIAAANRLKRDTGERAFVAVNGANQAAMGLSLRRV